MLLPSLIRDFVADKIHRRFFENRTFWDERYTIDPKKGSGPGSRGQARLLKNRLIRMTLEQDQVTTVLDIGCGDIAILEEIEIERYVGIDISSVVIEKNKVVRPDWLFLCEDLTGAFVPEPADLVLCLDVLIHQRRRSDYKSILSKTIGAAKRTALISGYAQRDPGWNVYFHEPIEESIQDICQSATITKIAEYRGTQLLKVNPNGD